MTPCKSTIVINLVVRWIEEISQSVREVVAGLMPVEVQLREVLWTPWDRWCSWRRNEQGVDTEQAATPAGKRSSRSIRVMVELLLRKPQIKSIQPQCKYEIHSRVGDKIP